MDTAATILGQPRLCLDTGFLLCLNNHIGDRDMIKQTLHNIVDFKISDIQTYSKGTNHDKFHTRRLIVTDEDGHKIELTLFTNENKEVLLPKKMEG